MILRTFNCTIVNQIKSSTKLVVKLKIRNLQLLIDENYFQIIFWPSAVVFAQEQMSDCVTAALRF